MLDANTPGHIDQSFAHDGRFYSPEYNHLGPIRLINNGEQLLITCAHRAQKEIKIMRLERNGRLDTTFGNNGVTRVQYETSALRIYLTSVVTDRQGRIMVLGDYNYAPDQYHAFALRLDANGQPDTRFGGGKPYRVYDSIIRKKQPALTPPLTRRTTEAAAHANDPAPNSNACFDDDTLYFASRDHLIAIDQTGELQTQFNGNGYWAAEHENGQTMSLGAWTLSEGKIVAAINPLPNDDGYQDHTFVLRMDLSGKLDKGFAENGYLRISAPGHTLLTRLMSRSKTNGNLLVCAVMDTNDIDEGTALASITPDGKMNPAFNGGQLLLLKKPDEDAMASPTAIAFWDALGTVEKLYIACMYEATDENGDARSPFATARINGDGTMDRRYSDNGWVMLPGTGLASELECQADGKLLVAASLRLPDQPGGLYVTRLLA